MKYYDSGKDDRNKIHNFQKRSASFVPEASQSVESVHCIQTCVYTELNEL